MIAYDCTIQDLAFQVLNPFGANSFKSIYVFHDLVCQDLNTSENDCQELAFTVLNSNTFFVQDLACQVLCSQVLTVIELFKTWNGTFWGTKFQT